MVTGIIKKYILNKTIVALICLAVGVTLGLNATKILQFANSSIPKPAFLADKFSQVSPQPTVKKDLVAEKQKQLEDFYSQIIFASDNQDWSKLYDLSPNSVKNNVTRDEFVKHWTDNSKKYKIVSTQTFVKNIHIEGDKGFVDRKVVTCLSKECTGDNHKEENAVKNFDFVDGKWEIQDPEPTERALKAANYGYENSNKENQKSLRDIYGYGHDDSSYAVRNWAVYLDQNLEELIRVETLIENYKTEKSKPVYYQPPAQIIQQPAPVIQQQAYPKNCTSNTIGSYTYTNCY